MLPQHSVAAASMPAQSLSFDATPKATKTITHVLSLRGGFALHQDAIFEMAGGLINTAGGLILVMSCLSALFNVLKMRFGRHKTTLDEIRLELGESITFALQLLVAADVIDTLTKSAHSYNLEHLYKIGLIVAIRTILGYFVDQEIFEIQSKLSKIGVRHHG